MTSRSFVNCLPCVLLRLMSRTFLCIGLVLSFFALDSTTQAATAITETTGAGNLGTHVLPPSGNVYGITGGTPAGTTNLFHSFAQFSVGTGDIAQFQTTTLVPNTTLSNILGRVTGGSPSSIFGTVDSITYYPNANLFLMNPNGILFGPGAHVNVGGMAHFTTADYLRLDAVGGPHAGIFHADMTQTSVLTNAPVAAFGFLGSNPAAISVQGSQLTVANGTGLSLVGGNHGFNYKNPDTSIPASVPDGMTMTGGMLSALGGQINIVSVASAGEISTGDFMPTPGMTMGNIALSQGAILDVSGDGGGTVRIRGGQFLMDQSTVIANTTGASDGAPIAISVNVTDVVLLNNHSALVAKATNAGHGGDIEITGRTIDVAGTSNVRTESTSSGSPGNITATASESISVRGTDPFGRPSQIFSESSSLASTGSITLRSPLITLSEGVVRTGMFGPGAVGARAGDITIETTNLNLIDGGMIRTESGSDIAPSGNIYISAGETVTLAGTGKLNEISNITNENLSGGAGNISIQTGTLSLSDQARINSQTWFDADPAAANQAKISVTADSTITLSTGSRIDVGAFLSDAGKLELSAQNLIMSGASSITTLANASGAAGPIMINVQDLSVSDGSQIVSTSTQGFGRGGDITINATGSVLVTGQGTDPDGGTVASGIFSNTRAGFEDPSLTGNAGNISITGHSIEVSNGARIDSSSQSFALGNAGNIDLVAPTITVNGGTISTSTEFAGQAGTITLRADRVTLNNGGELASSSIVRQTPLFEGEVIPLPSGNAGTVTIQGLANPAQSVLIDGAGSGLFTDTQGTGAGGNIFVNANSVTLQNGSTLSANTSGTEATATGGTITVDATDQITMTGGASITASSTGLGNAGNISINAGQRFEMRNSSVKTEAIHAGGGNIDIQAIDRVRLVNSTISTSVLGGSGSGGNITIDPNVVVLQNSQIIAKAVQGAGGNITITTPLFLADQTSLVSASSQFGLNGTVTIQSPTSNLSGSLGTLSSKPNQAQRLLTQRCAALVNGQASSFVVAGREQLPADPGGWLSGPIALAGIDAERSGEGTVAESTSHLEPRTSGLLANDRVSLRRLTPAGFLIANFADSKATGCHS